jgi:hypothetical protein
VHSFGRRRRSANSTLETSEELEPETEKNVTASEGYSSSSQDALDHTSSTESDKVENIAMNNATASEDEEVDSEEDLGDIHVKLIP